MDIEDNKIKYKKILEILTNSSSVQEIIKKENYIFQLFPICKNMKNFDQHNKYHSYDLWTHTIHVINNLPKNINFDLLFIAALFHDIGKIETQTFDKDGFAHYYKHEIQSKKIVDDEIIPIIYDLHIYSIKELRIFSLLVEYHDVRANKGLKSINMLLDKGFDYEGIKYLMYLEIADGKAHKLSSEIEERISSCEEIIKILSCIYFVFNIGG